MPERDTGVGADNRIELRIGINLGDVIVEGDDLYGDGVNIAARVEGIAEAGGICISEDAFRQVRGKVAADFADLGEQSLKNIARPVRVYRAGPTLTHPAANAPGSPLSRTAGEGAERRRREAGEGRSVLPLPDKPSIAVLPFANMSGDPEQEYFADGMVEEIITALSRIRWLFVIARNSSFTYKGEAVDVKQVGRELGVRYVLEGSVRKAGGRVRITAQLIDATTGTHLWADRFDGSLEDVFELQDKVAVSVAGVIEPTLQAAEARRSAERPTGDLTAHDLYLRAFVPPPDRDGLIQKLDLLGQAIERDPRYGPALAWAAVCRTSFELSGWTNDAAASRREALDLARRALRVAPDDPGIIADVAYVLGYYGEDISAAMALIDRALELNPSFADGWRNSGWLRLWAGQPDLGIDHIRTAMRLSPRASLANSFLGIGVGHFFARRFEEAKAMLLLSLQELPSYVPTNHFLASCYAQMGRLEEAREIVARLQALTPMVVPIAAHWRNPEHRELFLEGLRLAAGEAT
jgi:TolB-like protein